MINLKSSGGTNFVILKSSFNYSTGTTYTYKLINDLTNQETDVSNDIFDFVDLVTYTHFSFTDQNVLPAGFYQLIIYDELLQITYKERVRIIDREITKDPDSTYIYY